MGNFELSKVARAGNPVRQDEDFSAAAGPSLFQVVLPNVITVRSFEAAWHALLDTSFNAVVLRQDTAPFRELVADLEKAPLDIIPAGSLEIGSAQPDDLRRYFNAKIDELGLAEHLSPSSRKLLVADQVQLTSFLSAVTRQPVADLRTTSIVGHIDQRGTHIDTDSNIVIIRSYIGPGPDLASNRDLKPHSYNANLALRFGAQYMQTNALDTVFLKGRYDLSNDEKGMNNGAPHRTRPKKDPINGWSKRLTYLGYTIRDHTNGYPGLASFDQDTFRKLFAASDH